MRPYIPILALLLTSCSLAPDALVPDARVPDAWLGAENKDSKEPTPSAHWEDFGSTELNDLITKALAHNTDLSAALARVEQSRANTRIAGGALYPSVEASGSADRTQRHSSGVTTNDHSSSAGLSVAYELDLWQKNRNSLDSSLWSLRASEYDKDALALTVASETARIYSGVLAYDERVKVAEQNLTNAREVLRITELRFDAGSISGLERAQQRTSVSSTEAAIASLKNQRALFFNQLATLTGVAPSELKLQDNTLDSLTVASVPVASPWELLERRPDIAAAEARLRAANIDIGVARANALPSLSLALNGNVAGSPSGTLIGLGASFFAPIFEGGALQGAIERSEAVRDENTSLYESTLLVSFREVEDALATYDAANSRRTSLETGAKEAREAYRIARARFDAGSIDFTTLIDTQTSLLSSEDNLLAARQDQLAAAIDLTRALGGGWNVKDTANK